MFLVLLFFCQRGDFCRKCLLFSQTCFLPVIDLLLQVSTSILHGWQLGIFFIINLKKCRNAEQKWNFGQGQQGEGRAFWWSLLIIKSTAVNSLRGIRRPSTLPANSAVSLLHSIRYCIPLPSQEGTYACLSLALTANILPEWFLLPVIPIAICISVCALAFPAFYLHACTRLPYSSSVIHVSFWSFVSLKSWLLSQTHLLQFFLCIKTACS